MARDAGRAAQRAIRSQPSVGAPAHSGSLPAADAEREAVRVIAIVGHRSAGKTTLGDAMLFRAGVTRVRGAVENGTSLLDNGPEEVRRRTTLGCSFAWLPWGDQTVYLVDTPGTDELTFERDLALSGVDGAVIVVHAGHGVQVGTRQAWTAAARARCPVVFALTHVDRPFDRSTVWRDLERLTGRPVVALSEPLAPALGALGTIDLRSGATWVADPETAEERRLDEVAVPEQHQAARDRLVEAVAETDDALVDAYLEDLGLDDAEVDAGLRRGVREGALAGVVMVAPTAGAGVGVLLDAVVGLLPPPSAEPRWMVASDPSEVGLVAHHLASRVDADGKLYHVLRVWRGDAKRDPKLTNARTAEHGRLKRCYALRGPRRAVAHYTGPGSIIATWEDLEGRPGDTWCEGEAETVPPVAPPEPVVSVVLRSAEPEARMAAGLELLRRVDGAIVVGRDELTGQITLRGAGETHLGRAFAVLRDRLGLVFEAIAAPIAYREAPMSHVEGVAVVHKRSQPDEHAEIVVSVRPIPPGSGALSAGRVFVNGVDEDTLPARFVSAVEDGVWDACAEGPLASYPVAGIEVRVTGGDYHALISEEAHFREAGARALRAALALSGTCLWEPWSAVSVSAPSDSVGPVISELVGRGGRIVGMDVGHGDAVEVRAECPERALIGLAPRLKGITGGAGTMHARRLELRRLPDALVSDAIAASPFPSGSRPKSRRTG
jgi:elongation factor G